jgi:hypothetical protein
MLVTAPLGKPLHREHILCRLYKFVEQELSRFRWTIDRREEDVGHKVQEFGPPLGLERFEEVGHLPHDLLSVCQQTHS